MRHELNTIRNTSGQCPAQSVVSMVSGPGRVHERMTDGNSACIGENSVEHKPGRPCVYRVRYVSV